MAFESLSERLQNAIKMFRGTKEITEEDLKEPLRQVRMALLEADVNFKVAKNFVEKIKQFLNICSNPQNSRDVYSLFV